jgi:NitT/TauT family transport system substrate-binding protein
VIDRFVRAAKKTNAYIQENPQALRDIIPTFTDIDESVAAAMVIPEFPTELDRDSAESLADAMVETGVIEEAPSIDDVLAPAGE